MIKLIFLLFLIPSLIYGGVYFDGVDDYVGIPAGSSINLTTRLTLMCWANFKGENSKNTNQGCIAKGYPNKLQYTMGRYNTANGNYLFLGLNLNNTWGDVVVSSAVLKTNQWYFLAVTWDGTTAKAYINGNLDNSASASGTLTGDATTEGWIGAHRYGNSSWERTNGELSDVKVYNRALTQDEITTLYNGGNVTDGLICHWDFHEGTGLTLGDVVGSNDGTITGATWVIVEQDLVKGLGKTLTEAVNFTDILSRSWTLIRTLTEGIKMRDINNRSISRLLTDAINFVDAKAIFWKIFHGWRKKKSIDNTFWSRK